MNRVEYFRTILEYPEYFQTRWVQRCQDVAVKNVCSEVCIVLPNKADEAAAWNHHGWVYGLRQFHYNWHSARLLTSSNDTVLTLIHGSHEAPTIQVGFQNLEWDSVPWIPKDSCRRRFVFSYPEDLVNGLLAIVQASHATRAQVHGMAYVVAVRVLAKIAHNSCQRGTVVYNRIPHYDITIARRSSTLCDLSIHNFMNPVRQCLTQLNLRETEVEQVMD